MEAPNGLANKLHETTGDQRGNGLCDAGLDSESSTDSGGVEGVDDAAGVTGGS